MINQEKVRDMTRMAAYENGDGEKEIRISMYRKQDYVALQLIKAFFFGTVAYAILLVFWLVLQEDLLIGIDSMEAIEKMGTRICVFWVIFLAVYMTGTFIWACKKYNLCRRNARNYMRRLRRVRKSYEKRNEISD